MKEGGRGKGKGELRGGVQEKKEEEGRERWKGRRGMGREREKAGGGGRREAGARAHYIGLTICIIGMTYYALCACVEMAKFSAILWWGAVFQRSLQEI